jgi:uncharacterized protein (DUF58 family)
MRSLFAGLTARGRSFLAAGAVIGGLGFGFGQRALVNVGLLLVLLPLLAGLAASRARYRIRCQRQLQPPRVAAGQRAEVIVRLDNISRLPTGLLLAEDVVPYTLGQRPRFVLDRIEQGGARQLIYQVRPDSRGRYAIGPFRVRAADVFGLVQIGHSFAPASTLVVTPAIVPLEHPAPPGSWLGDGEATAAVAAAAGEDDVVPRVYRHGDDLRRVHWRSTARHGELMVRREEQHWRNQAVIFLDTRSSAHAGRGPGSSFEFAVSAAASIGVHLARERMECRLVTDSGAATVPGRLDDGLLDTLAVIQQSRTASLTGGLTALTAGTGGLLVAITGRLSAADARHLAAARRSDSPALALLLAVSSWVSRPAARPPARPQPEGTAPDGTAPDGTAPPPGPAAPPLPAETAAAAEILTAAGWRVAAISEREPLTTAWQRLHRPGAPPPGLPASGAPAGVSW